MSFHKHPEYNSDAIRAALEAHNLPVDEPSMLADSFRIGWLAASNHAAHLADQYGDWTYWGQDNNHIAATAAAAEVAEAIRKGRPLTSYEITQLDKAK